MQMHVVPVEFDQEEKIMGGFVSLRQTAYLAGSAFIALMLLEVIRAGPIALRGAIAAILIIAALALAFLEHPTYGRLDQLAGDAIKFIREPKAYSLFAPPQQTNKKQAGRR